VGAATNDVNTLGFRDLSGNGYEWTRSFLGESVERPLPLGPAGKEVIVLLRGQSYRAKSPLLYEDLRNPDLIPSEQYTQTKSWIGFRVVVEP
jgi:formylglycine-generating enzyme required for sulfatase activity